MAQGFQTALSEEERQRVYPCQLRGLGALLKRLLRQAKTTGRETARTGGYKIKRKYANDPSNEEERKTEADILQVITRALRGEQ